MGVNETGLSFAAGVGHYRNANATALGLFYKPVEDIQWSLGAVVGNGNSGFNGGVSFKLGSSSDKMDSSSDDHIRRLEERLAKLEADNRALLLQKSK